MEQIIECNNLTHYYGKRLIYENLSFTVPKGRILGLLGKNGTGKTTTINILSGYLKPRSGECRIFGQEIQTMAPALRRNIGLLIEGHVQYQFMTITEIEKILRSLLPRPVEKKEAYYELMNKLKVATGQRISRMSCGQRSQVALGLIPHKTRNFWYWTTSRSDSIPATAACLWTISATMPVRKVKPSF